METLVHHKPTLGLRVRLEEGIARVELDVPSSPANLLTVPLLTELEQLVIALGQDAQVLGVVLASAKQGVFCAGVDLPELTTAHDASRAAAAARLGQRVFARLEDSPKPIVAAIHGTCVGGGCEMALACHWRVFADDPTTRIGLPEVTLGIIPSFGGTQRLPQVADLPTALELLTSGELLDAPRAHDAGLADELVRPDRLLAAAAAAARRLAGDVHFATARRAHKSRLSLQALYERTPLGREILLRASEKHIAAATHGHYPAPRAVLEAVRAGLESGGHAFEREAELVGELAAGDVARHLVHLFQLAQEARQAADALPQAPRVHELALVGTGVMGAGIAVEAVQHDLDVHMEDTGIDPLLHAYQEVRRELRGLVRRGRMQRQEMDERMKRLYASLDGSGLADAEVVIEAVDEDLGVKQAVLCGLEARVRPDCVLASNTSSLSVTRLAAGLQHPERCLGMHFFNPVQRVALVEIAVTPPTSPQALSRAFALAEQLGKTPIVVRDGPGLLVNRILGRYLNEAARLFACGWPVDALDALLRDFGMPRGPFELLDDMGIEVAAAVTQALEAGLGERFQAPPLVAVLRGAGRLGRARGRGIYRYSGRGGRTRTPDREFWRAIGPHPEPAGIPSAEEALDRLLVVMLDEAARCLDEGVVTRAETIDLGLVTAMVFPAFRGGLLQYSEERGLPALLDRLRGFETELGPRFSPSERLVRMVAQGESFSATMSAAAPAALTRRD